MRKKMFLIVAALLGFVALDTAAQCAGCSCKGGKSEPVNIILDADFGSSTDDGHPDIPVGLERNGVKHPRCYIPYNTICQMKDAQGNPRFKRSFDSKQCLDGYKLYRKLLSKAEDNSIVVVAIGFATSLAQLFESKADEYSQLNGVDLFAQKVRAVYIQSGRFEANDNKSGYNMRAASHHAAVFYDNLPAKVDIVMSPSNVGDMMHYLPEDVLADLKGFDDNPIKVVHENYKIDPGQRMWDTNCLVQAVFGDACYNLSPRGKPDPNGNARYQLPDDGFNAMQKLMQIRRENRR